MEIWRLKTTILSIIMIMSTHKIGSMELDVSIEKEFERLTCEPSPIEYYKKKMAILETNDLPYTTINKYGYIGKYQFSKKTIKGLIKQGYLDFNKQDMVNFRFSLALQERAMDALIKHNLDYIYRNNLDDYVGMEIGGVKVTMNGMLAACHLVGPKALKRFLKSNGRHIKRDGFGTSIVSYMVEFNDGKYEIK